MASSPGQALRTAGLVALAGLVDLATAQGASSWKVFAGRYSSFWIDPLQDGMSGVLAMGRNDYNQLGIELEGVPPSCRAPVVFPQDATGKVTGVAAGAFHTLFLTDGGDVYGAGRNNHGQLGDVLSPTQGAVRVPFNNGPITSVAVGYAHSLLLNSEGQVYGMGWNAQGQLGLGHTEDRALPTRIFDGPSLQEQPARAIAAGHDFSFILTEGGTIYAFGNNMGGQLGIGNRATQLAPVKVPPLPMCSSHDCFLHVSAGTSHSTFVADRFLYSSGANFDGQLGNGTTSGTDTPVRVGTAEVPESDARRHAGGDGLALLDDTGGIQVAGSNRFGQLGLSELPMSSGLFSLDIPAPSDWSLGPYHSFFLVRDNSSEGEAYHVHATGANQYGQLGDCTSASRATASVSFSFRPTTTTTIYTGPSTNASTTTTETTATETVTTITSTVTMTTVSNDSYANTTTSGAGTTIPRDDSGERESILDLMSWLIGGGIGLAFLAIVSCVGHVWIHYCGAASRNPGNVELPQV